MSLQEAVHYRRSVRLFDESKEINPEIVEKCLQLATLAPNSSNMQLWEFYHITSPEILKKLALCCFGQDAATTAKEMVVFVTRQDLHRKREKQMMKLETDNVFKNSPEQKHESRSKRWKLYYGKVMPLLYTKFFGVLGLFRKLITTVVGIYRPTMYQVSEGDVRVVVHKTCALAAQTFMLAMANEKYDTCPMEGFDSRRVKKVLNLPYGAEINMIVSCGIRKEGGVWGDRMRVPFPEVYHRL